MVRVMWFLSGMQKRPRPVRVRPLRRWRLVVDVLGDQEKVLSARPRPRTWALPSRAVTTGSERCGVAVVRAESALLLTATGLCGGGPGIAATGPCAPLGGLLRALLGLRDRKSTRLNSSHVAIS